MADEKITTPKEETVSKAEYDKLKIALEVVKNANKDNLKAIEGLKSLRAKDSEMMHSLKVSSEFVKNGGNDLYFEDFKKLTKGDEKVDYEALKMKYKPMFNQTTQSVASPVNQQTAINQQGAGRVRSNANRTVGINNVSPGSRPDLNHRPNDPNEWMANPNLLDDS